MRTNQGLMKYIVGFVLMLFCLFNSGQLIAQDAHFSQFYASPLHLNPALAGTFDGSFRINFNYRDQWRSALESPLSTFAVGGDLKFNLAFNKTSTPDVVGAGILFYSDRVNGFDLNTNSVSVFGAYHKALDKRTKQYLGIGMQFGITTKSINYEDLTFQDQFNSIDGYTFATAENLPPNNYGFLDLSAGINYAISPSKSSSYHVGFALQHFTTPNVSFYQGSDSLDPNLVKENNQILKITGHINTSFQISEALRIQPRLLSLIQGDHLEINLGNNFRYEFIRTPGKAVHFGGWFRMVNGIENASAESFIIMGGIEVNQFIFGLSYDQNLNDLVTDRLGLNAFELSITYLGEHDNTSYLCPEF